MSMPSQRGSYLQLGGTIASILVFIVICSLLVHEVRQRGIPATVAMLTSSTVAIGNFTTTTVTQAPVPVLLAGDHKILAIIEHDSNCFTQGLLYHRGYLYESCGLNGKSSIRKVDPDSGKVLQETKISNEYFAEGLTAVNNRLYLLTWLSKVMLVFDVDTLNLIGRLDYGTHNGEGWGLTYDEKHNRLVVSDGSAYITFFAVPDLQHLEHAQLRKLGEIAVKEDGRDVTRINELEITPDGDPLDTHPIQHLHTSV